MKNLTYLIALFIFVSCGNQTTEKEADTNDLGEARGDTLVSAVKEKNVPFLGQSAGIVISAVNYSETVKFYETLGWKTTDSATTSSNGIMLSDGCTVLVINEDSINNLAFGYNTEIAPSVYNKLSIAEIRPAYSFIDPETAEFMYNEYMSPDSLLYRVFNKQVKMVDVINAGEIFSAPIGTKFEFANPVAGTYQEYALSVEDLDESIEYWEKLGFETNGIKDKPYRYTIVYDGLMIIGLHETKGMWDGNVLTYSGHGVEENKSALAALKAKGFAQDVEAMVYGDMVFEGNFLIPDPAGNVFMLTTDLTLLKK